MIRHLTAAVALIGLVSPAVEIHVAPQAATPRQGTREAPFTALSEARDAARRARADGQPVTVILHGGLHVLPETLQLGPADSGTAEQPVVWQAAPGETPVLSGGAPIADWRRGEKGLWQAQVPEGRDWAFDQLFVDGRREIRARHPNRNEEAPHLGDFLFARLPAGGGSGYGGYLYMMLPGYWTEYDIAVPADGEYQVWFLYGAQNQPFGTDDMAGRCSLLLDGEQRIELDHLPDTGDWKRFHWAPAPNAALQLRRGNHRLRWTNDQGPGLNIDAIVLCSDPAWKPAGTPPTPTANGHLVEIQAEHFARKHGEKLAVQHIPSADTVHFDPGSLGAWERSPEKELVIWIYQGAGICSNMIQPILAIDPEHHRLTIARQKPSYGDLGLPFGARFFVENAREALDAPGEWYYDRQTGLLEYFARNGQEPPAHALASRLERLIDIGGGNHIHFVGLTFAHTAYQRQRDHWYHSESNAVRLLDTSHCRFLSCTFRNLGGGAIVVNGTSTGNEILGCEVTETGAGAFTLNSHPENLYAFDPQRYSRVATTRANRILGNHIHRIGQIWKHGAGVYLQATDDNEVMHNDIHDTARHPVIMTGRCGGNDISFNRILNSNLETGDTGAIHTYMTYQSERGNRIRNNLIGDVVGLGTTFTGELVRPYYTWGIYLDNDTDKTLVRDNIVFRNVRGGIYIHGGSDNLIENNILVDAAETQFYHGPSRGHNGRNNRFERNVVAFSSPAGTLGLGPKNDPDIVFSDHNLFWAAGREIPDLERLRELGMDRHSLVADPLFIDPANDDYRLQPDSPAFGLGFLPIDTSRIGRQGWRGVP